LDLPVILRYATCHDELVPLRELAEQPGCGGYAGSLKQSWKKPDGIDTPLKSIDENNHMQMGELR